MKTDSNIIRYASKSDYLKRSPTSEGKLLEGLSEGLKDGKVLKTDASQKGLESAGKDKGVVDDVKGELKKGPKKIEKAIKDKVSEGASAGKHLAGQAISSLAKGIGFNPLASLPIPDLEINATSDTPKPAQSPKPNKLVNKPGIFFVKGFSLNPFSGEDEGLGAMAENVPSSELYSWSDGDALIEAINSRPHTQPIILVGHGMGGDTAVDVANRLNAVEHGFRRVDLLVTMDSIGTDNDIIPQNVRENFNVISDADYLFNDGPNIARTKSMTSVSNELRTESHNELEESPEVQFLVYEKINRSLMSAIERRDIKKALNKQVLRMHQLASPGSSPRIQNLLSNKPAVIS